MVYLAHVESILFTIAIGVIIFVIANLVIDLFGDVIKQKFKKILPKGTQTTEGEITR